MNLGLKNAEGNYDLTVYEVIRKISREEEKRKKLIYVCSPFRGDEERNTQKAQRYCKFVVAKDAYQYVHISFFLSLWTITTITKEKSHLIWR